MLNYLATALPAGTSPDTRLIALQCALRMNARIQVSLPHGLLRSLRLGFDPRPWQELEQARWLRRIPNRATGAAVLLDATLLGQAPTRPDRCHAADRALRASCLGRTGALGPLPQVIRTYLAARSLYETGHGLSEADRTVHECGIQPDELPHLLEQLTGKGLLRSWWIAADTEDLHWILRTPHCPQS
ncbi:hypothetical protein [Streptomyces sp. MB09-02B]|uniref:hypothetical protein n=1 Tax=Streptomyces sp. MB09-02B TaxID=3028667 RepID=UPI0029AC4D9A|nr:hypothetical protein [Streptomyces sp. MB09-02B]MDX3642300.1 hypothetical protein [Streptomyces sp. MB09-02B]